MKRFLSLFITLTLCAVLLLGCGGSAPSDAGNYYSSEGYDKSESMDISPGEITDSSGMVSDGTTALISQDRKLIKTVYLDAETENYDTLITGLDQKILDLGGYVQARETRSYRTRSCSMTIRIPADRLGEFVIHVREKANLTHANETTDDVTLEYVDTEAKIKALETEQERLLELLAQAQNLSEILEIEARLSDVTYELERYASHKRTLDNQVDYATVYLSIQEVEVLTPMEPLTVWQRIAQGFPETLRELWTGLTDAFVWVVVQSPNILVTVLLVFLLLGIGRLAARFQKKRPRPPKTPKNPTQPPQSE